jgi:RNA polymerase-binding transcription factor DksA
MDKQIIEKLKQNLEKEQSTLKKGLEGFAKEDKNIKGNWDTKPLKNEDADMEEKADEAEEYDNLISLEHSLELKFKDVNLALEKIKTGDYGRCEKCGKEIEEERLLACPEARLCLKCNK